MLRRVPLALVALTTLASLRVPAVEENIHHNQLNECILYKGPGGHVWVGHMLVGLGMIGVNGNPPIYRLSPAVAEKFQPLVNDLKQTPEKPCFWFWGMPRVRHPQKPLVVVEIEFGALLRKHTPVPFPAEPKATNLDTPEREYEITSLKVIDVEFIGHQWREAWDGLDGGLKEIVAATRTPPGAAKRERLQRAIDRSSQHLRTMVQSRVTPESRGLVARLASKARVLRTMQQDIEEQWGGQLRQYLARLRISPHPPLLPETKPCPTLELLSASKSPAEFLTTIRKSWPEETLDKRLIYALTLKRLLYVWQVEDLTQEQFSALKAQAREELARAQKEREHGREKKRPDGNSGRVNIESWGVVLRPADPDLLAEKGLLQGALVETTLAPTHDVGLRSGDVIFSYHSVYDLVMAGIPSFSSLDRIKAVARNGGRLDLIRGDRLLTIAIEKK